MQALKDSFIGSSTFISEPDLAEILENPKLIVIINHSTPLSWIPAICILALEVNKQGGGNRIPRGIVDKFFYQHPLLKMLAEYITQVSDHPTFENILESFNSSNQADLVIFPEGANSFFGDPSQLQPFRSPRFVEIAVRTQTPILLVAHTGSENWSFQLPIPAGIAETVSKYSAFFGKKISSLGHLNIPLPTAKIPHLKMKAKIYNPSLTLDSINREQLTNEADKIHLELSLMLSEIRSTDIK